MAIFDLQYLRQYKALPLRTRIAHLGIVTGLLLLLPLSSVLLSRLYEKPNYRQLAYASISPQTEIAVFGSCQVYHGIRPDQYSRPLVNIAGGTFNYEVLYKIWIKNRDRMPNLKTAVIQWDYRVLLANSNDPGLTDSHAMKDFGLDAINSWREVLQNPVIATRQFLDPLFRWRLRPGDLVSLIFHKDPESDEPKHSVAGFVPSQRNIDLTDHGIQKAIESVKSGYNDRAEVVNLAYLEKFFRNLKEQNIKILFLKFPVHPRLAAAEHDPWIILEGQAWTRLSQTLAPEPLTLLDYYHLKDLRDSAYRDFDHLNDRGAREFAKILDSKISE